LRSPEVVFNFATLCKTAIHFPLLDTFLRDSWRSIFDLGILFALVQVCLDSSMNYQNFAKLPNLWNHPEKFFWELENLIFVLSSLIQGFELDDRFSLFIANGILLVLCSSGLCAWQALSSAGIIHKFSSIIVTILERFPLGEHIFSIEILSHFAQLALSENNHPALTIIARFIVVHYDRWPPLSVQLLFETIIEPLMNSTWADQNIGTRSMVTIHLCYMVLSFTSILNYEDNIGCALFTISNQKPM